MLAFLGLTNYSRHFVPDYAEKTGPLQNLIKPQGHLNLTGILEWTPVAEEAFITLKQTLSRAATLAIPDYNLPFYLKVSDKPKTAAAVLYQKQKGGRKILLYISVLLDGIEQRAPPYA